jgi:hypothetical protein
LIEVMRSHFPYGKRERQRFQWLGAGSVGNGSGAF